MTIMPLPKGPTCPMDKQVCGNEVCVKEGMCQRSDTLPTRVGFRGEIELVGLGTVIDPTPTPEQLREGLRRYMEQMKRVGEAGEGE